MPNNTLPLPTLTDSVYEGLLRNLRYYGPDNILSANDLFGRNVNVYHNETQPSRNIKLLRKFSKKNPLKLEIINESKLETALNQREYVKQIKFYKNILKNDKTLTAGQIDEIGFLIQQNRLGLRLSKTKNNRKLKISYKGKVLYIDESSTGFFNKNEYKTQIKTLIKEIRNSRYLNKVNTKVKTRSVYEGIGTRTIGGVHEENGSILHLYHEIGRRRVNSLHLPQTNENHVGVEIEFYSAYDRDIISERLIDAKLTKNCRIMGDSSIRAIEIKPYGYWTKEKCHEEALKYQHMQNYIDSNFSSYSISYKKKWLKDIIYAPIISYYKDMEHMYYDDYYVSLFYKLNKDTLYKLAHPAPVTIDPTRSAPYEKYKIADRSLINMHHGSYVRTEKEIAKKFENSSARVNFNDQIEPLIYYFNNWQDGDKGFVAGKPCRKVELTKVENKFKY